MFYSLASIKDVQATKVAPGPQNILILCVISAHRESDPDLHSHFGPGYRSIRLKSMRIYCERIRLCNIGRYARFCDPWALSDGSSPGGGGGQKYFTRIEKKTLKKENVSQ
jgi:hypothetical protein